VNNATFQSKPGRCSRSLRQATHLRRAVAVCLVSVSVLLIAALPAAADYRPPFDYAAGIIQQSDGKLVAGGTSNAWNGSAYVGRFALVRYKVDGSLDRTFGGDGRLLTPLTTTIYGSPGYAVTQQTDGKIIVAGLISTGTAPPTKLAIARYLPDGTLDGQFGFNGVYVGPSAINYGASAVSLAADPAGGFVVGANGPGSPENKSFTVERFTVAGTLDTSFSPPDINFDDPHDGPNGGDDSNQEYAHLWGLTVEPDRKVVAVGDRYHSYQGNLNYSDVTLVRYNSDGSLDSGFGAGGEVFTQINGLHSYQGAFGVAVDGSSRIDVAGFCACDSMHPTGPYQFSVGRFSSTGQLDTDFGSNGFFVAPEQSFGRAVVVSAEDAPVATGGSNYGTVRLSTSGQPDSGYGAGGSVFDDAGTVPRFGSGVAGEGQGLLGAVLQPDGKDVVAGGGDCGGCEGPSTGRDFALARHNTDGSLDMSFGVGGKVLTDFEGAPVVRVTNPNAAPDAPSLLSPPDGVAIRSTSVTFSWSPALGAQVYDLVIDGRVVRSGSTDTRTTMTGLSRGRHTWGVRARNSMGSADSTARSFTVEGPGRPVRLRAIGDSVTAAFGFYPGGTPMPLSDLVICLPPKRPDNRCSSPQEVAYPAVYARRHGIKDFANFAVSGATPRDWASGFFSQDLTRVVASDPDITALTLGANPVLATVMTTGQLCVRLIPRTCVDGLLRKYAVASHLRYVYERLLDAPRNHVFVMEYPYTVPALLSGANVHLFLQKLNAVIEGTVRRLQASDPRAAARLRVVVPPAEFARHGCLAFGERWILRTDFCIHPNIQGQQALASALERPIASFGLP
jgi:uncharacterized delta-60 repeat protein